jgi:hypothetical protein
MLGRYGRRWVEALRNVKPELARSLEEDATLETYAQQAAETAEREEDQLLSAMLQQSPLPDGPPLARVEHHARLRRRAEEIATAHLLEEFEESDSQDLSPDETTG